jgi:hypothetical protein
MPSSFGFSFAEIRHKTLQFLFPHGVRILALRRNRTKISQSWILNPLRLRATFLAKVIALVTSATKAGSALKQQKQPLRYYIIRAPATSRSIFAS